MKKTVYCDELQMDPFDQDRLNWIKGKLSHRLAQDQDSSDRLRLVQPLPRVPPANQVLPGIGCSKP